jgi:hypothetical protein
MEYIDRSIENKKVIWFKLNNQYLLLEIPAYEVVVKLLNGDDPDDIALWCAGKYELPDEESTRFVTEIRQLVEQQTVVQTPALKTFPPIPDELVPLQFYSVKHYLVNNCAFSAEYETDWIEHLIHPKFAHLEVNSSIDFDYYFQVFQVNDRFALRVNGAIIGQWLPEDAHFLAGKFSMEMVNRMGGRKHENEWMAVFHASAVQRDNHCVLFLGDSGNGKSTTCAILMSSGFDLVADDFVPVDAVSRKVFCFPAAVSVKKNAIDNLLSRYPQLESADEFYYPGMDKTVRYLAPSLPSGNQPISYPCEALIFVKYQQDSGLLMERMPADVAFQHLVPDSWISPLPENASLFLDWFLQMPCYRLTYSDNEAMVSAISALFENEL